MGPSRASVPSAGVVGEPQDGAFGVRGGVDAKKRIVRRLLGHRMMMRIGVKECRRTGAQPNMTGPENQVAAAGVAAIDCLSALA